MSSVAKAANPLELLKGMADDSAWIAQGRCKTEEQAV